MSRLGLPPVPMVSGPQDMSPTIDQPPGRAIDNPIEARDAIFGSALDAVTNMRPATANGFTLRVVNPHYVDPPDVHPKEHKKSLLTGGTLGRRMKATWELLDPTGKVVDTKSSIIARVPSLQEGGVFIHNGGDYGLGFQKRLRPGVFVRRRQSGDVEAHVNVPPGQGLSHRYRLDPKTRKFKVAVSGSEIPLVPLLKALGSTDEEISNAWGDDIYKANQGDNYLTAIDKLAAKFGTKKIRDHLGATATPEDIIKTAIEASPLDPSVSQRTLGGPIDRLNKDVILHATKRAIGVSAGTDTPDDREHEAYQHIVGPEDLFAERLLNDHAGLRRMAAWKAATTGNLQHIQSGLLTPQLEHVLTGSGLATHLEDVNPLEAFDRATRITPMGEGGLPDTDAIPDEARDVRPSHYGFADPARTVESLRVGVDLNLASGARKGKDGRLYSQFTDSKTGKPTWLSAHDIADKVIGFPHDEQDAIDTPHGRYVPVLKNNRDDYVKEHEVDVRLPKMNKAYSILTNLIPFLNASKPHRLSMGARMLTQALPLVEAEAPLVRPEAPDDSGQQAHEVYGRLAGAIRSGQEGVVTRVESDRITLRGADGQEKDIFLSTHRPNNRKSGFNQTPVVKVGQFVRPDSLLAKSNFTDSEGNVALGRNLLTAYLPYEGLPHEDAIAISESAAKKLTSEHYYQHHAETAGNLMGTKEFVGRFPTTYSRDQLNRLDDSGVIRVGEKVEKGHPLVLGLKPASTALNRVHRKGEKSLQDASLIWDHDDPGEVTDVVQGPRGPVVVVKTHSKTKLADKLCFDPETRLRTKDGWKFVADVTTDDWIATLNPVTDHLEWQKPTHTWSYDYSGDMYELSTKTLNMLVTPEHRLWVQREKDTGQTYQAVTAGEFFKRQGRWRFKKDCLWAGREQERFVFPKLKPNAKFKNWRKDTAVLTDTAMDDWLEFLGYYIAEGWCRKAAGYVLIGQFRTSPHWQKINDLLLRMGLSFTYAENDGRFSIGNVWLWRQLRHMGNSYTKRIPDFVQELSPRQIRIFFDAYMDGDGHRGPSTWEFSTSSEGLAYDLQLLILKLGWATHVSRCDRTDNLSTHPHWRGRVIRSQLRPLIRKDKLNDGLHNVERMVKYTGKVHCITVPNHIVYAERRDKTYWSLNSGQYG